MLDYRLLQALFQIRESGGFEKAADVLCISQSAVSQRLKALEEQQGQILISRQTPPIPTERGMQLIKHYRQVMAMEEKFLPETDKGPLQLGINADSLDTWFFPAIAKVLKQTQLLLELKVDDQDETEQMLKRGEVAGCISSSDKPLQGCSVHHLGIMKYYLVSTPVFAKTWFADGLSLEQLAKAPMVAFNRKDHLHERYLRETLSLCVKRLPQNYVPSPESFKQYILANKAYGMVPLIQMKEELQAGKLVILNQSAMDVNLYWHHWNLNTPSLTAIHEALVSNSHLFLD